MYDCVARRARRGNRIGGGSKACGVAVVMAVCNLCGGHRAASSLNCSNFAWSAMISHLRSGQRQRLSARPARLVSFCFLRLANACCYLKISAGSRTTRRSTVCHRAGSRVAAHERQGDDGARFARASSRRAPGRDPATCWDYSHKTANGNAIANFDVAN